MAFNKKFFTTGGIVAASPSDAPFDPLQNFETVTYTGNGGTQKITGYIRKGAAFNGSSSNISIGSVGMGVNNFTYSFWFNTNNITTANANIISPSADHGSYGLQLNTSGLGAYPNTGDYLISSTGIISPNTWYHVAYVKSSTAGHTLYLNGSSIATNANFTGNYNAATGSVTKFGSTTNNIQYFNGKLDQIRFFNTALSQSEVTTLKDETYASSTKSTTDIFGDSSGVALYELDENANDTGGNYNGTATNVNFLGMAFQPDFVWIKSRDVARNHYLYDSIRGANNQLISQAANAESTVAQRMTGFISNGFSIGTSGEVSTTNEKYVAWSWKAGGAYVTDISGDLDADISANVAAGFSIIRPDVQTGVNQTIPHGLSQSPELIIQKNTAASQNWMVYAPSILDPSTRKFAYLNTNGAFITGGASAGTGFVPTVDSTFITTPGVSGVSNYDYWFGKPNIIYAFHSVDEYQKVGSYSGGTSGYEVTLDFTPRFVMIKNATNAGGWLIVDSQRGSNELYPHISNAEDTTTTNVVLGTNKFTLNTTGSWYNASGSTYIYLAIA